MGANHDSQPGWNTWEAASDWRARFFILKKGYVPIGILGMIADIVGVSENGVHATQLNAFIKIKTAEKKLQFCHKKCNTITIANKHASYVDRELVINH